MRQFGARLARVCPRCCVIYLVGELGVGKSTLARGFIKALGYEGAVKSPTYTLVEPYDIGGRQVYHLDLYRLSDPEELEYLGLRDWLDGDVVLLVEWPQKGCGVLPEADLTICIEYDGEGRSLVLMPVTEKGKKLLVSF